MTRRGKGNRNNTGRVGKAVTSFPSPAQRYCIHIRLASATESASGGVAYSPVNSPRTGCVHVLERMSTHIRKASEMEED
jgi:hypothetical protein